MPPKNPSGSRPRSRPRTRAIVEELEPEPTIDVVDEELINDEDDDTEEDPDWELEELQYWVNLRKGRGKREGAQRKVEREQSSCAPIIGASSAIHAQSSRPPFTCWNCGEKGHIRHDCPLPTVPRSKARRKGPKSSSKEQK